MKEPAVHTNEISIYPGAFCRKRFPKGSLRLGRQQKAKNELPVSAGFLREFSHYFQLDLRIPGVKREDIIVLARHHLLDVLVYLPTTENAKRFFSYRNPGVVRFEKHLVLPRQTDTDLIQAEYRDGILRFFIPKTSCNPDRMPHPVPVY